MAILLIQAVDNPPCADDRLRYLAGDVLAVLYDDEPIGDAERNNPQIKIVKVDADPIDLMHLLEDPLRLDEKSARCRRAVKLNLATLDAAKVEVVKEDAKLGQLSEIAALELVKHEAAADAIDAAKRPSVGKRSTKKGQR